MMTDMDVEKINLRKEMTMLRRSLDKTGCEQASIAIARKFIDGWGGYTSYALYSPILNEVNTIFIANELWNTGKKVLYPRVCGDSILFGECRHSGDLSAGYKGILEPCESAAQLPVEVVIVPGVAFDTKGNRLGYGRGYYDRCLADTPRKIAVGIAYEAQIVENTYPSAHDQPMDVVITESSVYWRRSR